jgi:hypothetical protein
MVKCTRENLLLSNSFLACVRALCVCLCPCPWTFKAYKAWGYHDIVADDSSFVVYYAVLMAKYVIYSPYLKCAGGDCLWLEDVCRSWKHVFIVHWNSVGNVKIGCKSSRKLWCYIMLFIIMLPKIPPPPPQTVHRIFYIAMLKEV